MIQPTPGDEATFEAPGAGHWALDRTHFTGGTTPIVAQLIAESMAAAFRRQWREFGVPAETMDMRFVHGFAYTRVRPLFGADSPKPRTPPAPVIKLLFRIHPELRRRTKAARTILSTRPWQGAIAQWNDELRPALEQRNRALQAVDLTAIDDRALADHLDDLLTHLRNNYEEHFRLHGYDLGPIGLLVANAVDWGLPAPDVLSALAGASPSTTAPRRSLRAIRDAVTESGATPVDLDGVRDASPRAAVLLDEYLARHGSVLFSGYDIDSPTLGEAPGLVLTTILHAGAERLDSDDDHRRLADELRARLPEERRARFDELLADARSAMDLRDDNGPMTVEWPTGLLRLALLEAGRRLEALGRVERAAHAFELEFDEPGPLLRSGDGPSTQELARRAEVRERQKRLDPPPWLGPAETPPDLSLLPPPLAELMHAVTTLVGGLGMTPDAGDGAPLRGIGVGAGTVEATARIAESAEDAFDVLEAGEILVTRTTSPAYNMVLTLVGGLITTEGGPMCHAAVLSRELGITAAIGVSDALSVIADGDTVEIDGSTGIVRVIPR